jgi:hypothetical protein
MRGWAVSVVIRRDLSSVVGNIRSGGREEEEGASEVWKHQPRRLRRANRFRRTGQLETRTSAARIQRLRNFALRIMSHAHSKLFTVNGRSDVQLVVIPSLNVSA